MRKVWHELWTFWKKAQPSFESRLIKLTDHKSKIFVLPTLSEGPLFILLSESQKMRILQLIYSGHLTCLNVLSPLLEFDLQAQPFGLPRDSASYIPS